MSEFSRVQLNDFAHGRLDDSQLKTEMLRDLEEFPNGQVAEHLKRIKEQARHILDTNDSLFLNFLVEVPNTRQEGNGQVHRGDLIVLPQPEKQEIATNNPRGLVPWSGTIPARMWNYAVERPKQTIAAAVCAIGLTLGGFQLAELTHRDELSTKIAAVDGRQLVVAGEQTNLSLFVVCDPSTPISVRLDQHDEPPTDWHIIEPSPSNAGSLETISGVRVTWPEGRPGCVVEVTPSLSGILYLHQSSTDESDGGWYAIGLPLTKTPELFTVNSVVRPEQLDAPFTPDDIKIARAAWASFLQVDQQTTNEIGQSFVLIPPGSFTMGSPRALPDSQNDETEHRVEITTPWYACQHEVTQGEFRKVMGYNPAQYQRIESVNTDLLPVENLMWFEMIEFCNRLSHQHELRAYYEINVTERVDGRAKSANVRVLGGDGYRLPTEAEWEYMCRAGTETRFYTGDSERGMLSEHAYVLFADEEATPHAVGTLKPNNFGLYDMHGNIFEWVYDWYDEDYYRKSPRRNPTGATAGYSRVIRGGSFKDPPRNARAANRGRSQPDYSDRDRGFRIVRSLSENR